MARKAKSLLFILLLLFLILPSFKVLLQPGYFPMHDDMQAMRLLQMDKCVQDGQIPCRWVPDMGFGYGYPQFNYYAPLPYYIMEVFHLTGFGYLDSVKVFFVLSVFISAIGIYVFSRDLWGKSGAILSILLYVYAPYRAMGMFVRGAVGELAVFAVLPFLFWSAKKLVEKKKYAVLWFALSYSILLTSHNISSMIFTPLIIAWIMFLFVKDKKENSPIDSNNIIKVFFGFVWGAALAAFFVIPAWFERNLVQVESIVSGYFNYLAHFVGVKQILFSNYWGYGSSQLGIFDELLLSPGILHWTIPTFSLLLLYKVKARKYMKTAVFLTTAGYISLFMMHPRSSFVWNSFGLLHFVQFPWRFLLPATFFFSAAAGALGVVYGKKRIKYITFLILIFILLFNARMFKPSGWLSLTDSQKFSGEEWQRQQTISILDYLPVFVEEVPGVQAPNNPVFLQGQGNVVGSQSGTNWAMWKIINHEDTTVRLPIYYFPNWEVYVNGHKKDVGYDNINGLMEVRLDKGVYTVRAHLKDTPIRVASNIITFIALLMLPVYVLKKGAR